MPALCFVAQVDYYNATGGRWEPLLEKVVAKGDREVAVLSKAGKEEGNEEDETRSVVRLSCAEEEFKVDRFAGVGRSIL